MTERSKYLLKNIGVLTISNLISKVMVFVLVPLYTSVLSSEDVGIYDLAYSSIQLTFPIFSFNIIDAIMRFSLDETKKTEEVAVIGAKYIIISSIISALVLCVIARTNLFPDFRMYIGLIFLYYCVNAVYQYMFQLAKGMGYVSAMGIAGVIGTATMLISNIIFLLDFRCGLNGFFIANILGLFFPVIYLASRMGIWKIIIVKKCNISLEQEMLIYCIPLIVTSIGWWVNSASDKYVVSIICGVAATGILSVSYKIPSILNTLLYIFTQAWHISAVKEYGHDNTPEFYGKTLVILNSLMAISCSLLILFVRPLGKLLFRNDFFLAWQYVPYLLIATVINAASAILGPVLAAKKDSKSMAISAIYGAGINIVMNMFLVYLIGVQGATIATILSSLIIYLVRKHALGAEVLIDRYVCVIISWVILMIQATIEIYTKFFWFEILLLFVLIILFKAEIVMTIIFLKNVVKKDK